MGDHQFDKLADQINTKYPQVVLIAKKILWEDQQTGAAFTLLRPLKSPEAYAVLANLG